MYVVLCPARSPETDSPCVLIDRAEDHPAGHESAYVDGSRAAWATNVDDWHRWGIPVGIARATMNLRRVGRIHRPASGRKITAKRNRQRLRAKCGPWLGMAWPYRVDLRDPVSLCLRCYPEANPHRKVPRL